MSDVSHVSGAVSGYARVAFVAIEHPVRHASVVRMVRYMVAAPSAFDIDVMGGAARDTSRIRQDTG